MKNKVMNGIIIALVIGCLILVGKIGYDNYMNKCEKYNDNIVNFTVDLIKGNHSLEDIDMLDANDSVKESLRQYYSDTFYSDDDLILVYEDVTSIDNAIKDNSEFLKYLKEKNEIHVNNKIIYDITYDDFLFSEIDVLFYNRGLNKEELYFLAQQQRLLNNTSIKKNDENLILKDNNIYIYAKDFDETKESYVYNGYEIKTYSIWLNKKFINNIDDLLKNAEIKNKIIDKNTYKVILSDSINNRYTFVGLLKFGKIVDIEI